MQQQLTCFPIALFHRMKQTLSFQNPTDFVHKENKQIKVSVWASLSISVLNKYRNIHRNTIGGLRIRSTKSQGSERVCGRDLGSWETPSLPQSEPLCQVNSSPLLKLDLKKEREEANICGTCLCYLPACLCSHSARGLLLPSSGV